MTTKLFLKRYLFTRFCYIVLLLQVFRLVFFYVNREMFLSDNYEIFLTFLKSALFDFLSTLLYFIPYVCLIILFLLLKEINKWHIRVLNVYFSFLFWVVTLLSLADVYYYKFNLRRINLEALQLMKDSKSPISNFIGSHPSIVLFFVFFLFLYFLLIKPKSKQVVYPILIQVTRKNVILSSSFFLILILTVFFKFAKYFSPLSSSLMVAPGYTGLYTNSPQVFLYSFISGWTYVKPVHFYSDRDADALVPVFYANTKGAIPNKRNVILFILESFSYSYLDPTNPEKPSTPFFDSLINHSTFFTKAYANNTTSANGLCSILSGLPSLSNQPFFSSAYASNPIDAISLALEKNGYQTSFFLGANEDHFGFKKGTKLLGIQQYFNGESFPKEQHDGTWGVYDEPFLKYFAKQTKHIQEPFFSTFFTISSHYPFKIPDSLLDKFPSRHNDANERAVSYVDYAFKNFFDAVKMEPWFHNTVFIFTADHVSKENKKEMVRFNSNSYFHIPIFIFDPHKPVKKVIRDIVQHTDISSTIAELTQIPDTILCFGNSFFDTFKYHYSVNRFSENIIQMIDTTTLIQFDILNNKLLDIYKVVGNDNIEIEKDSVIIKKVMQTKIPLLKAYLQQYFNRLYYNRLYIK